MSKFKKQEFDRDELGLLSIAFSKNLFSRPQNGDISVENHHSLDDCGCTFFIKNEFYSRVKTDMEKAHQNGKFAESNANDEWVSLMNQFLKAKSVDDLSDMKNGYDYYESLKGYYWD